MRRRRRWRRRWRRGEAVVERWREPNPPPIGRELHGCQSNTLAPCKQTFLACSEKGPQLLQKNGLEFLQMQQCHISF